MRKLTIYEIPLISQPQVFTISLSGWQLQIRVYWDWVCQCWMYELRDASTLAALLLGAPLVTGVNLLQQYQYFGIQGMLIVQTDHDTLAMPTFDNLGQLSHWFYIPFDQSTQQALQ